jgi:hypothetical protein
MDFTLLLSPVFSAQLLTAAMLAILFLQSGIDKVIDWQGNLSWLKGHFAKSPLASMVPLLLGIITVFELSAGIASFVGAIYLLATGSGEVALAGAQLSALSLLMLFFGQRIAKDYAGAATLVPYFLLSLAGIWIMGIPAQ